MLGFNILILIFYLLLDDYVKHYVIKYYYLFLIITIYNKPSTLLSSTAWQCAINVLIYECCKLYSLVYR